LTSIPNGALTYSSVTVNGTTIALGATGTVTAAAGTLTGTTLNSTVVSSSLTSVGTIATGVWNGTAIGATYGGTGQTAVTTGDLLYGSATNTWSRLGIGSTGQILRVVSGLPAWGTDYTGTVTSVAATVPSFLSISGSPITTSGTLAIGLSGTALPTTSGGTGLTSFTSGGVVYASSTSALATSSALTFDGTNLSFTGNLIPTTAGKGINFTANTPASGMTSQNLTWYEEGTWTPGSGVGSATSASGVYTRIGRQVTVIGTLTFPTQTNAGLATITGLPFTCGATGSGGTLRYTTLGSAFFLYGASSATTINCFSTAGTGLTYTSFSGVRVDFTYTYFV